MAQRDDIKFNNSADNNALGGEENTKKMESFWADKLSTILKEAKQGNIGNSSVEEQAEQVLGKAYEADSKRGVASNPIVSNKKDPLYTNKEDFYKNELAQRKAAQKNKRPSVNPANLMKGGLLNLQTKVNLVNRDLLDKVNSKKQEDSVTEESSTETGSNKIEDKLSKKKSEDKKKKAAMTVKGSAKKSKKAGAGMRKAVNKLLQSAWTNSITTFSLSLFWVYTHVFLSFILKDYFCQLGHEWIPEEVKRVRPNEAKQAGDTIGCIEKPLCGCACFLHLLIILGILALLVVIVYIFSDTFAALQSILKAVFLDSLKAVWDLVEGWFSN